MSQFIDDLFAGFDAQDIERACFKFRQLLAYGRRKTECTEAHGYMDRIEKAVCTIEAIDLNDDDFQAEAAILEIRDLLDSLKHSAEYYLGRPKNREQALRAIVQASDALTSIERAIHNNATARQLRAPRSIQCLTAK